MTDERVFDLLVELDRIAMAWGDTGDGHAMGLPIYQSELTALLETAVRAWLESRWTPVGDGMPEPGEEVLAVRVPGREERQELPPVVVMAIFDGPISEGWSSPDGQWLKVTHWMHKPAPPGSERQA